MMFFFDAKKEPKKRRGKTVRVTVLRHFIEDPKEMAEDTPDLT